jgi:hypothetical protein
MLTPTRRQILAFRVAAHGLAERAAADPLAAAGRSWALQDSPPGAAATAALARAEEVPAGWLDRATESRDAVALYNARTATSVVAADDTETFATGQRPFDDAGLKAVAGSAVPGRTADFEGPVQLAVDAIASALGGAVLSRDALHQALRERLPGELLPWCEPCQSHHARRGLLVMASLHGRLCVAGRAGRQPAFARTDQWLGRWQPPDGDTAGAALARTYLAHYGPSTYGAFGQWAGLGTAHAKAVWSLVAGELAPAGPRTWILARDASALADPPAARGVRLLGPGDPLLQARDREILLDDERARKQVWKAIGGAGVVLVDGIAAGLWRARKQGRRLVVSLEAFGSLPRDAVAAEAERLAPHRGCSSVELA